MMHCGSVIVACRGAKPHTTLVCHLREQVRSRLIAGARGPHIMQRGITSTNDVSGARTLGGCVLLLDATTYQGVLTGGLLLGLSVCLGGD